MAVKASRSKKQFDERPAYSKVTKDQATAGGYVPKGADITAPLKAIREKCKDCCGGLTTEIEKCTVSSCPLRPFRFQKNPFRTPRRMDDETKAQLAERLKQSRKE